MPPPKNCCSEAACEFAWFIAVSANLDSLYEYLWRRLVDANVKNDTTILDEVLDFTTELRDTWKEAMKLAKQG